jgi:hypothetical protein
MDKLGEVLLEFLTTDHLKQIMQKVYNILNTSTENVYVYYISPLSNLKSILSDGGIKCREALGHTTDLSSHNVQRRRDISLKLAREVFPRQEYIEKRLHECVNFFWNPLNDTFHAFQRNALVLNPNEAGDAYGIVCLVELDLSSFFQSNKIYWCTSEKNLAVDSSVSYLYVQYNTFKWDKIFNLPDDRESNQYRSAEFIAYYQNTQSSISDLIPTQFITRILIPATQRENAEKVIPSGQSSKLYYLNNEVVFRPIKELLKADKNFIKNVMRLRQLGLSVEKFCELFNKFSNFKCRLTPELFSREDIAYSYHGIGHVTRVMFWINILSYIIKADPQIEITAQYAAFIHDLCRKNQQEDQQHGIEAADKFSNFLKKPKYLTILWKVVKMRLSITVKMTMSVPIKISSGNY